MANMACTDLAGVTTSWLISNQIQSFRMAVHA